MQFSGRHETIGIELCLSYQGKAQKHCKCQYSVQTAIQPESVSFSLKQLQPVTLLAPLSCIRNGNAPAEELSALTL